jgi:hypothetical protein
LSLYYQVAQVQDFQKPTAWIEARYEVGDGVICEPVIACAIPMGYYFDAHAGRAHLDADSPGRFQWDTNSSVPVDAGSVDAYAAHHRRVFLIYAPLGHTDVPPASASMLTSLGCREIDIVSAPATGADTIVMLFQGP